MTNTGQKKCELESYPDLYLTTCLQKIQITEKYVKKMATSKIHNVGIYKEQSSLVSSINSLQGGRKGTRIHRLEDT